MINNIPNNKLKSKAAALVQRAIKLVDIAINNKTSNIVDKLETLANDIKPFMAAEQMSSTNNAPISVSTEGDSSKNELLKTQLAQTRLAQTEQRLDEHFAGHTAVLEQMRILSAKLAGLDITVIHFKKILEMLREAFKLLGQLREKWHELVLFFKNFSAQVVTGFEEKLKSFLDTSRVTYDLESSEVDRIIMLELLNGNSINLYRESYLLFIMARTYYDVSRKYLMPRLAGLSLMLAATNDDERNQLFHKLKQDTEKVQAEVQALVNERKNTYKKVISEKRAGFNEHIDDQGADGNEQDIIEQGKRLLRYEDTLNK
jgi:gas vesicle protein